MQKALSTKSATDPVTHGSLGPRSPGLTHHGPEKRQRTDPVSRTPNEGLGAGVWGEGIHWGGIPGVLGLL